MKKYLVSIIGLLLSLHLVTGQSEINFGQNLIDSLYYELQLAKDDSSKVYLHVDISKAYFKTEILNSIDHGQRALRVAEKSGNSNILAYALFNLGNGYFQQGLYEHAIPCYFQYLEIKKEEKEEKAVAYALVNIGAVHLALEQLDEAHQYFLESLEVFKMFYADTERPGKELISIYNNLGIIAKQRDQIEDAIHYYNSGISLALRIEGWATELGNLYNNLGNLYLESGKFKESFNYLKDALDLRTLNDDRTGIIKSYLSLARYYKLQNLHEKSLEYLYRTIDLTEEVGMLSSKAEALELLFDVYQDMQILDSALKYHIDFTKLRGELNKDDAIKELKQYELMGMLKEKEQILKLEQQKSESRYLLLSISLLFVIAVLSLLLFLIYTRNKRLKLEKENMQLLAQNNELINYRLEKELEIKNKELTSQALHQIQINDKTNGIISKLKASNKSTAHSKNNWLTDIIKDLKQIQDESVWEEFDLRFQQVNNDFYENLNALYPKLTTNERRLCALLKLNMNTKDITLLTGLSIRSVEVARTRLRKKLGLTNTNIGLTEMLASL